MKHLMQLLLPALLALTLSVPAQAGNGRTPVPSVPAAAKGSQCVEDPAVMRRNHMDYLKHHRDETVHRGIRTEKHSLKACIECHVPAESTGVSAGAGSGDHFCVNCHVYAGVSLDCFECHATRPDASASFHPLIGPSGTSLRDIERADSGALLHHLVNNHQENTGVAHE